MHRPIYNVEIKNRLSIYLDIEVNVNGFYVELILSFRLALRRPSASLKHI